MKICGVELSGFEATVAVVNATKSSIKFVKSEQISFKLDSDDKAGEVQKFYKNIVAFMKENKVKKIAIKKRNKKGQYAGGAITFKMEGLFQLIERGDSVLLAPQSISACNRKNSFKIPEEMEKAQQTAYFAACTLAHKLS